MTSAEGAGEDDVVFIPVLPSFKNFGAEMGRQAAGIGRKTGEQIGHDIASGIESAKARVDKATEVLAKSQDKVADATGRLRAEQAKLNDLVESGKAKTSQLVAAEERVEAARRKQAAAARDAENATETLARAQKRAADASDEADGSTRRFSGALDGLKSKASGVGGDMKAAALGVASIGTAAALAATGIQNAALGDKLAAQLNLSPEEQTKAGQIAGGLYAHAYGESMEQVNDAVGAVHASLANLTDAGTGEVESLTKSALNLSSTFGIDVATSANTAALMIRNGLAKDGTESMDLLTTALQRVPPLMRDELIPIVDEYGGYITSLGFNGQEAMGLLVNASQNGAIGLDKAGDALKEFGIRATDLGDTGAQDALKSLGLVGADVANQLLAGGDTAKAAFDRIVSGLAAIPDSGQQAAAAVALFGTPLEDLDKSKIPGFLTGLQNSASAMDGFAGSAAAMDTQLSGNTATSFETLKRSIQTGAVEALGSAATWMQNNETAAKVLAVGIGVLAGAFVAVKAGAAAYAVAQGVAAAATGAGTAALAGNTLALGAYAIASGAMRAATVVAAAAQWALNAAMTANPIGLIVVALGALVAAVVLAYKNSETFRDIVQGAWQAVQTAVSFAWNSILKPVFDALGAVIGFVIDHWKIFAGVLAAITGPVGIAVAAIALVVTHFDDLKAAAGVVASWIGDRIGDIVGFITGLPGRIAGAASGMWDGIKDAFRGVLNWIIQAWNGLEFKIPGFDMGPVHFGGFTLGVPDIPTFAGGGRITGRGTGTSDSILIAASNGEFMEPARAVTSETLPWLEAIRAGWVPPAGLLHALVPGFAGGGLVSVDDLDKFARGVEGQPYEWGGVQWGDCSGAVSAVANFATGRAPFGSRFATGNEAEELAARGFQPGLGPAGSLNVGWYNGGPYGGHTALTLPNGTNFEMGGARGDGQYGGMAAGADDPSFTDHAHLPPEYFKGGDRIPGVDIPGVSVGTESLPPSAAGGTSPQASTTAPTGTTAATTSTQAQSMSISDWVGETAKGAAQSTLKDTMDFFGVGAFADLPIVPAPQQQTTVSPQLQTAPGIAGAQGTPQAGDEHPAPAGEQQGALVQLNDVTTFDVDELVRLLFREANHLVRGDAIGGIGGWSS